MNYKSKMLIFMMLLFLVISCGDKDGDGIIVKTDQENNAFSIPADGKSYIKLIIIPKSADGDIQDETEVQIKTDNGSFSSEENTKEITLPTQAGKVTPRLYAPNVKGEAKIRISFTNPYTAKDVVKNIIVKFTDLSIGKKLSACNFSIACDNQNIAAYVDDKIKVECHIQTEDRSGAPVDVPDVKFRVEAGKMEKIDGKWYYVVEPEEKPKDVLPLYEGTLDVTTLKCDGSDTNLREPCRKDGAKIKNPRDGMVTIMAYANGEECFFDQNNNKEHDQGEIAYEDGEPYVDYNDNGKYDNDEEFIDLNGNNQRDYGNGAWDNNITISTSTRILLTGAIHEGKDTTRFEANGVYVNLKNQESGPDLICGYNPSNDISYTLYLMDENLNPIAGTPNESNLKIDISGFKMNKINAKSKNLIDSMGMSFLEEFSSTTGEKVITINFESPERDKAIKTFFKASSNASEKECADRDGAITFYEIKADINTQTALSNEQYSPKEILKTYQFSGLIP